MFRSLDAAYPPSKVPAGFAAALGYIGGNTPHVWTPDEWRVFGALKQAGIWVYNSVQDPIIAGANAGAKYRSLGFTPNAPERRFIVIDMEVADDDDWVTQFAAEVDATGYDTVKYNSLSAGVELPAHVIGEWAALWDGKSDLPPHTVAHQYEADIYTPYGNVDVSVWEDAFAARFGWGPR